MKLSPRALDTTAREAVDARFLSVSDTGACLAFSHSIVREAIYDALPRVRRIGLHRQVGEAIAKSRPVTPVQALPISRITSSKRRSLGSCARIRRGGGPSRDGSSRRRGRRRALPARAHGARRTRSSARRRAELLLGLGAACSKPAIAPRRARRSCVRLRRREPLGIRSSWRAALGLGGRGEFGGLPDRRLRLVLDEASAASAHGTTYARAFSRGWWDCRRTRIRCRHATQMSRSALAVARRAHDAEALADALNTPGTGRCSGPITSRTALRSPASWSRSANEATATRLHCSAQRRPPFRRVPGVGGHACGRSRDRGLRRDGGSASATAASGLRADFAPSARSVMVASPMPERFAHEGFALAQRAQNPYGFATFSALTFYLLRERGQLGTEFESGIRVHAPELLGHRAVAVSASWKCPCSSPPSGVVRKSACRAERFAERNSRTCHAMRTGSSRWQSSPRLLLRSRKRQDQRRRSTGCCRRTRGETSFTARSNFIWARRRADLGLLASALGRVDEAGKHFESAMEANLRIGARPALARTQADFARMLLRSDRPADGKRARVLVAQATNVAAALACGLSSETSRKLVRRNGAAASSK